MESTEENLRKRKFSEVEEDAEAISTKKLLLSDESSTTDQFNLIDFSDEMLLAIMQQLDSRSLIKLARTCTRLNTLAQDSTLWINVDLSLDPLSCSEIQQYIFKDVCRFQVIRSLKIRGLVSLHPLEKWKNETLTTHFLQTFIYKCPNLKHLYVHEAFLDPKKISIVSFPEKLKSLTIESCQMASSYNPRTSFFSKINFHFKDLEALMIENCNWFDTHDLIAFSKIPKLKVLSLKGCSSFKECVPYGSIATRFGFQSLEVLDVRETPVTDSDIQCFNITKSLKELRMQCPKVSEKKEVIEQNVSEGEEPGTSGESNSNLESVETEQIGPVGQVISLHIRQRRRDNTNPPQENPPVPPPQEQNNQNDEDNRVLEAGAEFNAGNNNVRINIRNQNVQGRNVIHIVLRNNHTCNRNNNNNNDEGNDNENNNLDGAPQRNDENIENPEQANRAEPVRDQPAAEVENGNVNEQENENNDQNNGGIGGGAAQHYIMIRGFREPGQNDDGEELNPARIVQYLTAQRALSNPYQFYNRFIQFQRTYPLNPTCPMHLITDRGICSFGQSTNSSANGLVWIRSEQRSPTTLLESIIVRDYKYVTDSSLQHLSSCAPHLKFLDVIGTEVSKDGIEKFKLQKPECRVISNFGVFYESSLKSVL